jgi:DNA polymerase-3 subunit epsilon
MMASIMSEHISVLGFDCETTGTDAARDHIVSAALVRRVPGGHSDVRTWLIDPGIEIPAAAERIHRISTEQARAHGAKPAQALDELAQCLAASLTEGLPLLIFNASFDLRILGAELTRNGLASLEERIGAVVKPVLDPLVIDRGVDRYRKGGRKLPDLMAHYQVPPSAKLHDAAEDVNNSIAVLDRIIDSHPQLPTDPLQLHDWQIAEHREWATSFNRWLASKGRAQNVDPVWP